MGSVADQLFARDEAHAGGFTQPAAITPQDAYVWALCAWREARGDGNPGMLAVAWQMHNRLLDGRWGNTMHDVVEDKLQYSSMTAKGDPETVLWPNRERRPEDLAAWVMAQQLVQEVQLGVSTDPTHGATFYFAKTIAKPSWAAHMTLTASIGNQQFYRG